MPEDSNTFAENSEAAATQVGVIEMKGGFGGGDNPSEMSITAARFAAEIELAGTMPNLKVLVLNIDSPGGSSLEVKQIAEIITAFRKQNPGVKIVANVVSAYSAAFWTACMCDYILLNPEGGVGSVGAYNAYRKKDPDGIEIVRSDPSKARVDEGGHKKMEQGVRKSHEEFRALVYADLATRAEKNGQKIPSLAELNAFDRKVAARQERAARYAKEVAAIINNGSPLARKLFKLAAPFVVSASRGLPKLKSLVQEQIEKMKTTATYTVNPDDLALRFRDRVSYAMTKDGLLGIYHQLLYQSHTFDAEEALKYGMVDGIGQLYGEAGLDAVLRKMGVTNLEKTSLTGAVLIQQYIEMKTAKSVADKIVEQQVKKVFPDNVPARPPENGNDNAAPFSLAA